MCEGVRHNIALGSPLQSVIANSARGLHGRLDIARLNEPPLFIGVMRPYACKAIGLQLDANLELITVNLIHARLSLLYPRQNAEQVLHMVADLAYA
jgi:hypothetical protein